MNGGALDSGAWMILESPTVAGLTDPLAPYYRYFTVAFSVLGLLSDVYVIFMFSFLQEVYFLSNPLLPKKLAL